MDLSTLFLFLSNKFCTFVKIKKMKSTIITVQEKVNEFKIKFGIFIKKNKVVHMDDLVSEFKSLTIFEINYILKRLFESGIVDFEKDLIRIND